MPVVILLVIGALAVVALWLWSKRQRRKTLLQTALSDRQHDIILDEVPLIRRLPSSLGAKLDGKISLFLDQITFHGCNGLDVTEEMELSIAAQACLLVVNTDAWYEDLRTVLIYPGAFKSKQIEYDGYIATEREVVRLGESWVRGPVVLSWAHSEEGAQDDRDGRNVVFHEFAHQLDNLSGGADGAPILNPGQSFSDWARVFNDAFDRHVTRVETGRRTIVDPYGGEGPEEFFAVAVELFFENPESLRGEEPEVYQHLVDLFRLNPIEWN